MNDSNRDLHLQLLFSRAPHPGITTLSNDIYNMLHTPLQLKP